MLVAPMAHKNNNNCGVFQCAARGTHKQRGHAPGADGRGGMGSHAMPRTHKAGRRTGTRDKAHARKDVVVMDKKHNTRP